MRTRCLHWACLRTALPAGSPEQAKAEVLGRGEGLHPSAPQPRGAKTASSFLAAFLPLDIP